MVKERKLKLKTLRKASIKKKYRCVFGWATATIVFMVLTLVLAPAGAAALWADNLAATHFNGDLWVLEGKDGNAQFLSAQPSPAQKQQQALDRLQQESIVLLKNDNGALPLQQTTVTCKGDNEKAASLQTALTEKGIAAGNGTAILLLTQDNQTLLQEMSQKRSNGEVKKLVLLWNTDQPVQPQIWKNCKADAILWTGGADAKIIASVLTGTAPTGVLPYTATYGANPAAGSVYTGYKYYETRYEDFVMGTAKTGNFNYREQVAYPFGYGLSYTNFTYSKFQVSYDLEKDIYKVSVTVTNSGSVAAREIVQIYAQSPYTDYDRENNVEKPSVKLVGFGKTGMLQPGAAANVTVNVERRELASYDAKGTGTYVMAAGDYYLTVAADSHKAVNQILSAKGFTAESTENRMDAAGDVALTYKITQSSFDGESYQGTKNRFPETEKSVSRKDWEGTLSAPAPTQQKTFSYIAGDYATVQMPTMGAKNELTLYDMKGVAFDDPKWRMLLDQLTFDEMAKMMGDAYRWTLPVVSVQAPGTCVGDMVTPIGEQFLQAAFDVGGMYDLGWWAGNTALSRGETTLRCFGGSFEDSFLTGNLRTQQAKGIYANGVNVLLRGENTQWQTEQAAREQYLRAFQYTAEQLPTTGVALKGTAKEMLDIFRQEWGGNGMVIAAGLPVADGVMAGVTVFDDKLPCPQIALAGCANDPVVVATMRQACHYNLYALANSAAMNGVGENTVVVPRMLPLVKLLGVLMGLCTAVMVVFSILWARGIRKWLRSEEQISYRRMKASLRKKNRSAEKTEENPAEQTEETVTNTPEEPVETPSEEHPEETPTEE